MDCAGGRPSSRSASSAKSIIMIAFFFTMPISRMTPIKAIIEQLEDRADPRPAVLYWGARTRADLYLDEHGPSLRALYDLADPTQSRFMHSSGQSGIPWSPQYRSFVGPWSRVEYVPVWGRGDEQEVLVLKPGS